MLPTTGISQIYKLAVILEGVVARHAGGAYGEGDDTWRGFAEVVVALAERAQVVEDDVELRGQLSDARIFHRAEIRRDSFLG